MSDNPYHYSGPVSDPAHFAGRQEAIRFVQRYLVGGHQKRALAIFGPPQMGKSSLLRQLPNHLDERYCAVRLSLRAGTVAGDQVWLQALAGAVPDALAMLNIQSARLPELPARAEDLRVALLGDYLAEGLHYLRRDRHLLVMVDNAERLYQAVQRRSLSRDTFAFLAQLLDQHSHFDLLLAFESASETDVLALGPPFDPALAYHLRSLPPEETRALLVGNAAGLMQYSDAALDGIYELTAGHPYVVQVMGSLLFERSAARGHDLPIMPEDVEAVTAQAQALAGDTLGAIWHNGSSQEQLVLRALAALSPDEPPHPVPHEDVSAWLLAARHPLDPRTVNAAWRRLEHAGAVRLIAEGALVINGGLLRRWLREHAARPDSAQPRARLPWRRLALIGVAAAALALLLLLIATLPDPEANAPQEGGPTVTFPADLQATDDAYYATQTAIAP